MDEAAEEAKQQARAAAAKKTKNLDPDTVNKAVEITSEKIT